MNLRYLLALLSLFLAAPAPCKVTKLTLTQRAILRAYDFQPLGSDEKGLMADAGQEWDAGFLRGRRSVGPLYSGSAAGAVNQ